MNFRNAVVVGVAVWAVGLAYGSAGAQAPKSVWEGAFTEEQAKRGAEAYLQNCAECHGQDLSGDGFAPALSGADFLNAWNGLTVGDLFDRIRISMPPGKESAVPTQAKIDIVAYVLNFNKFPAGKTELPPQVEVAKQIKFESTKPGY